MRNLDRYHFSLTRALTVSSLLTIAALGGQASAQTDGVQMEEVTTVIQLGDSYSAGFGVLDTDVPGPPDGQTHCDDPKYSRQEVSPGYRLTELIEAETGRDIEFVFEACGGAQVFEDGSADLASQWEQAKNQLLDLEVELGAGEGTVIVLTFGGNDVRTVGGDSWVDVVTYCTFEVDPFHDCNAYPNAYYLQIHNLPEIQLEVAIALANIAAEVPEATIRYLGYPIPFQPVHSVALSLPGGPFIGLPPTCLGMTGLSIYEANFLDSQANVLNSVLENAVFLANGTTVVDLGYVDVDSYFRQHGACSTTQPFVNDIDWIAPFVPEANSLHPLQQGWNAYFQALRDDLGW
ncbi:MAG: hypothetical protein K0U98_09420 [Deltaproteobacteria bacterium]|nr:hypothetical protein [Deltaproteobacteria bacterium]